MWPLDVLAHHSEPVDPTLLEWIKTELDHIFGEGSVSVVSIIGILIVLFLCLASTPPLQRQALKVPLNCRLGIQQHC